MADLGELIARIGLDTSDLKKGVAESEGLLSGGLTKAATIAAAAVAAIGVAAVGFGIAAAHKFEDVGREVIGLQRVAGGTAEEMSRLRFAAVETGVGVDVLGNSIRILSGHLVKNDQAAKDMGIAYRDANGALLPTNEILLRLADRFASMPNGIEKTRLATELFGRAGTAMIPILNKGRDGLAELEAEASKFGLVLSTDNIDAIRANIAAHREWHAAWEGLQVQIGAVILPLLTTLTQFLTNILVPGIGKAADFARNILAPAMSFLGDVIMRVVTAGKQAWDVFMLGFNNPQAADGLTGLTNVFFEFGQRTKVALDAVKQAWDLFVFGFKAPTADTTLSGWDGAFFTLGQNVKKALDAIALAWRSVVAGFNDTNATGPVDGLNTAFFKLGEMLRSVFDWIVAHVEPVIARVSDLLANNFSQAVGAGAAALGILAIKAGVLDGALGTITAVFEALGAVIGVVSAPVLLVVGAIAALGVAAYVAYQKIQPFHDAMDALGNFLKSTFLAALDGAQKAWDGFVTGFQNPNQKIDVGGIQGVFQKMGAGIKTALDDASKAWGFFLDGFKNPETKVNTNTLEGKLTAFGQNVRGVFDAIGPAVSAALSGIADFVTNTLMPALGTAFSAIQGPLGDFVRYIREIAPQVSEAIGHIINVIKTQLDLIAGVFAAVFVVLSAAWRQWGDDLMRIVRPLFDSVKAIIETGIRVIRDIINTVLALINGDWGKAWDSLKDIPAAAFDLMKTLIGNALKIIGNLFATGWDAISQAVPAAFGVMLDFMKALPGRIIGALGSLVTLLFNGGKDLITGLFNGVQAVWSTVLGWAGGLAGTIGGWFGGAISWLYNAGKDLFTGFYNAVRDGLQVVIGWAGGLASTVGGWFTGAISWLYNAGRDLFTGLYNAVRDGFQVVMNWAGGFASTIGGWFTGAVSWLFNAGSDVLLGLWNGLRTGLQTVINWGAGFAATMGGFFVGAATWLFNAGIDVITGYLNGMIKALELLPPIVLKFTGLDLVLKGLKGSVDLLKDAKIDIQAHAETTQAQQALEDLLKTMGGIVDYSHPPPGTMGPPAFATGGLTHGPSLAGEKGQELVLPLNDLQRSRQLLAAHGQAITGASGGSAGAMGSSVTNYNLYGPIVASDPAELERQLEARARVAAMAGRV